MHTARAALAALLLSTPALADVVALRPALDNTLFENATGSISNGAGPTMFAGRNSQNLRRRAVLAFDLSSIPAGSTVTAARLTLVSEQATATSTAFDLHRLTSVWGEGASNSGTPGGSGAPATAGDATWLHTFFNTSTWSTPGGDFLAAASGSVSITGPGTYLWDSPGMVADVQAWLDGAAVNAGWLLNAPGAAAGNSARFGTREHATESLRPLLVVEYIPVPAPGVTAALGLFVLAGRRRR
jgi:hypothetical protein